MSELSGMAKIMQTLEFAKQHELGCNLRYFDVIEILGHIESLEETILLQDAEPSQSDVSATQNIVNRQLIANSDDLRITIIAENPEDTQNDQND